MAVGLARYFIPKILIIAEYASVGTGSKMSGFATNQELTQMHPITVRNNSRFDGVQRSW
jgi:hypothetical protein